ncbi:MobC family plasmid mobilization relaxosome protein [Burkholderia multivorans]|uniref:plasmid mobilization relaxosome protein MobC n=1 Tax=Burkholderia multivorans TaxID=87883 RepID=UPI001C249677|nr:plasmid mobilization relaxosome protein MobC [Burkholderia multivorans]MBU9443917.1 MobC family plasmid mobilization relaxosome protein [Burkholderia multivorans]
MPSKKPLLSGRVDPDLKNAFATVAKEQGVTEARLLEIVVAAFLRRTPPIPAPEPAPESEGVKTKDVRVRLAPFKYRELERLASLRHWSRGTYLAYLFDVHLSGQPRLTEEELQALREATAQLSAVGRNVNQIARALNTSLDEAHQAQALNFEHLKRLIDLERARVKAVIRANLKSWGVSDGEQ